MRVLVAGATGAIGTRLVPRLVRAGHAVVGLTRSPSRASALGHAGATPAIVDAFDPGALRDAVAAAKPDVVVHQLTALRDANDLRKFDQAFALTNRLRTQVLDDLLDASVQAGARRFVAHSYCGWPYATGGSTVKSEDDALDPDPPRQLGRTLAAIRHVEYTTVHAPIEGVVLRCGTFYGPDTGMTSSAALDQIRKRRFPLMGNGGGWWSFVHVDDVAAATAIAIERGAPGLYNIVDDDPAPVREWLPVLAALAGAQPPLHVPAWLGRLLAGGHLVRMMTASCAGSNAKARRELDWSPRDTSWRGGFARVLGVQPSLDLKAGDLRKQPSRPR